MNLIKEYSFRYKTLNKAFQLEIINIINGDDTGKVQEQEEVRKGRIWRCATCLRRKWARTSC